MTTPTTVSPTQTPPCRVVPPLDPFFQPVALEERAYEEAIRDEGIPLAVALTREGGQRSRLETRLFPDGHPLAEASLRHVERLVKFMLWQHGGYRLHVGGSQAIADHLRRSYAPMGA